MKIGLGKKMSTALIAIFAPFMANAQSERQAPPLAIDLEKAIEIALSENPTVKVADMEVQKKKYAKKSAQSALYPQIDLEGTYTRAIKKQVMYMDGAFDMGQSMKPLLDGIEDVLMEKTSSPNYNEGDLMNAIAANTPPPSGDGSITIGRDNTWQGGFNVQWALITPTLWKSIQLTSLDIELAVENARASKINMINSVRKSYYGVLLAKDSYKVLQQSYDNALLNYKSIKSKYEQGIVSEFDMIRADVNVKNIKPNLIQTQNAYNLSTLNLKALMGIDVDQEITVEGSLLDYEDALYKDILSADTTLQNNSDLRQFDIQTHQLQKSLELYKAQYLPTLAVMGNYTFMSMNNNFKFGDYKWNPYSNISVALSIPIFDGLKKHNDIKQTKVSLEQMKWQREDIVRNLQLAINSNVNNMTNYVEQVFSTKDVIVQARKGYEISQKLYDTGVGTLIELNDAQLGLTQASLAFNQAIYNYLASKADLDKTLGITPEIITENNK
ncbi:MAG: TolC family protein [Dysgonamonadaceae bacterium]|jgi:outer membrane protein TolC|nr:TolC family protein [Dysgonamonadaceae bacterium]